ncbi:hypothetical protein [Nocardioides sp. 1609]|uniref:hypothetical protein n=1 Tax=Nocardioides sp. 1609 TaxID=2508327 RepID=UPI001ADB6701|nr:hypothetical protein [Nocardioides sp. 1609]
MTRLPAAPVRRPLTRRAAAAAATVVLGLGGVLATAGPASAVTQADAQAQLQAAGIHASSSGGCTTQGNPTCTSYSGIRQATIDGARTLRSASGCALTVTGGTEVGHAGGTYSHEAGYKLDFSRTTCLTSWIHATYTYTGVRGDGAALYEAGSGNVYADEGNHWDVTFYSCGC